MSNYATLKSAISTAIKQNGNEEITGQVLQTTLLSMVDSLVSGYLFKGIATPSTVVGTPDENVFWIGGAGSYSNFGATPIDVPTGCIGIFQYNGSFTNTVVYIGGTVDISALSHTAYASLSQALGDLPAALHIGGIEVRYQDGTTSKFVKYRLMATSWSTTESDWQGVDDKPTAGSENLVKSGGVREEVSRLGRKITDVNSEDTTDEIEEVNFYDGETLKHQIKKDEANFSNLKSNGLHVVTSGGVINETETSDSDETIELADDSDNVLAKIDKEKVAVHNYAYISGGSLNQANAYLYKLNLDDLTDWIYDGWTIDGNKIDNRGHYGTGSTYGEFLYLDREYACDTRKFKIDFTIGNGGTAIFTTFWRNGGIGNPIFVDFPNGKLSIYIENTLIVEENFTLNDYSIPMRMVVERTGRKITATLISLIDFTTIAQAQTGVWVTSGAHLFDNFGVASRNAVISVSSFIVDCEKSDSLLTRLYITGDSITEGDKILDNADRWTTMLQQDFPTNSVIVSGRSAGTIDSVMARLYSECQFLHPKYVMVTIGTNGGNTAENISNLIKKIYSYGAMPIINHVPCISTGSQTAINEIIDNGIALSGRKVLSCKFDIATALDYDLSKGYDPTLFVDGVHPNAAGCERMYKRVKIDCPELFN